MTGVQTCALPISGEDFAPSEMTLRIIGSQVERLEGEIDAMTAQMAPLTSFILPGGTPLSASLHMARTVARRAERITVELAAAEADTSLEAIRYLNRLSDLLFVLARVANNNGAKDVLWVPGHNGDVKNVKPSR